MRVAFYKGKFTFYQKLIAWKTESPYTHCVAILDDLENEHGNYLLGAASPDLNGVAIYEGSLPPELWDIIDVPNIDSKKAFRWFSDHTGEGYSYKTVINLVLPVGHTKNSWFCDEAIAASAGMLDPWRFDPAGLAVILEFIGGTWIHPK